ncbi:mitogen-activated protein kinase-binding protein 1 isoform X2 [Aplysia californica]|uniref:Mitogen-activated protein kinase-binding protein 1 isoform X2 n=1 Tax=Aplysia californica TaxID=6500 RepID=A0ABM1A6C2_APLCA|nr:mitogen-activated protein kinase-binding protein 1 isoform X2 [Aplysia californica]
MDSVRPQRKVLRSPSVKRKSKVLPVNQRVHLERVLGVTVSSNAGLSCDSNNGTIAYPAGCVVVLFNPRRNKQSHIFNASKKTITALAISSDGKLLATGETGHQPAVRVWDVVEKTQLAEFRGHKFGINCVAFSPNTKELVSVGTQHDMMINVWNWKTGVKVASNKVSSKVSSVAFSQDGKSFVTVGNRHVRFWYLEDRRSKINQTVPLQGRSGILGDQKDNFFCDVAPGVGPMSGRFFVITQSGLLCEFNEKRQLDKWVELRTKSANCITAGMEHIFVGCAEGVARVFSATSLHYICSLPKPHHLGVEVTTATSPSAMVNNSEGARYPDVMAIAMDDDHKKVTCVYNDRSVYIWDVHDLKRVGKAWSFLYHSGCIWALEVYPQIEDGSKAMLPPGSFLTASGDDTIRVWNLNPHMPEDTAYKRNIYSNELLKIVYSDPSLNSLCNVDYNPAGATDKTDTSYDGKNGVRSIRVSPNGADLASGDRQGNIRIYDMQYLEEKRSIEAHESDVMCLEYSYTNSGHLLATASRDRLIHVFDVEQNYGLLQTLGDHSSSITAVRFTDTDNKLRMISCGADKSILLRNAVTSPDFQFQLEQHLATKITLYDMVIDPTQKCLATACQDRNVRLYNIQTTKEKKCYRGSVGDEGILLRIHLDPSGTYAVTTCTDKNVCILDFHTGEVVATMYGHSEVITGVKFANDLKHVITVSADGCIFVWRLPSEMSAQIKGRLSDLGKIMKDTDFIRSDQPLMPNPVVLGDHSSDGNFPVVKSASISHIPMPDDESVDGREDYDDEDDDAFHPKETFDDTASQVSLDYRFSVGELPNWAKSKKTGEADGADSSMEMSQPKGRWAQRVDRNVEFKSQLDLTSEDDTFSDRRRTLGPESVASQRAELRRETRVLSRPSGDKHNLPIIGDELRASTGDLRSSLPITPKTIRDASPRSRGTFSQYSSDTTLNLSGPSSRWADRFVDFKSNSLEFDDTDELDTGSDTTEVIYPPTDGDSDLFASSYKVFAVDDVKKQKSRTSVGNVANLDDASESTDPISLEDEEDPNDDTLAVSNPTTPSDPDKDFLSRTPEDKADFVRENFEEDSFTPVPLEKFTKNIENLERQILEGTPKAASESTPFSPRLSLSARFMSRSQQAGFKNFSSLAPTSHRPDNWFSRNKMEMTRAMDETRKSLLAMNLRSDSNESDSPDREDPPSPPTRLEQEESKFASSSSFASSPPTGAELQARLKDSQKDPLSKSQSPLSSSSVGASNHVTPPIISSVTARRISQERERRRSSSSRTPEQSNEIRANAESAGNTSSDSGTPTKSTMRTRPTYFKTTQSSRNKVSKSGDGILSSSMPADASSKAKDLAAKKTRRSGRLPGSKLAMYASTPNLISGMEDDDAEDEDEDKPQMAVKLVSTSNLKLLSDLSRSVPDVNEVDSSTDSSSCGSGPSRPTSRRSGSFVQSKMRFSTAPTDKQLMPPPTGAVRPIIQGRKNSSSDGKSRRKSSTSEMTLDQAKSILLGKSGILGAGGSKAENVIAPSHPSLTVGIASLQASGRVASQRDSRESSSSLSSVSTLTSGQSPPVFDAASNGIPTPAQLAVAEEIEHTANMLRHQKQANLSSSSFSPDRLLSHPPTDLEASPLDLPERDQPSPNQKRSSPKPPQVSSSLQQPQPPSSSSSPGHPAMSSASPAFHSLGSRTSTANTTFFMGQPGENEGDVFEKEEEEENPRSIRERIAMYQKEAAKDVSGSPGLQIGGSSSVNRRVLPASPGVLSSPQNTSQSDTGLGSESSDTDTPAAQINTATYSITVKPGVHESSPSQPGDRSRLALSLQSTHSSGQVSSTNTSISQCQTFLADFRSQLQKLKDLFSQVEDKSDETSQEILGMLGSAVQEANSVIMEIVAKSPGSPLTNGDSQQNTLCESSLSTSSSSKASLSSSSPPSQGLYKDTFQPSETDTVSANHGDEPRKSQVSSLSAGEHTVLLSSAKEMLQPLVDQLSRDLSQEIVHLIREKLDKMNV